MILSDITIEEMINNKECPLSDNVSDINIQPASLDITIGNTFSVIRNVKDNIIRLDTEVEYMTIETDRYILMPKSFVLATTQQYFRLPNNITAFVEGRSSIGRVGLFIQNAGWVDPGFEGQITLELFNASDRAIEVKAGQRVGQLVFAYTDKPVRNPYKGKYQCQVGATGSRIHEDFIKVTECSDEIDIMDTKCENCKYCNANGNWCKKLTIPTNFKNDYCKWFVCR